MTKKRIFLACILVGFVLISLAIVNFTDNEPKTIIIRDAKGLVNSDLQKIIIKNRFGRTIAKGQDIINKKTQPITDNTLSYKLADEKFYVETLYWGGEIEYDFKTKEFDYSNSQKKTEIKNPDGELVFEASDGTDNYYCGSQVKLIL